MENKTIIGVDIGGTNINFGKIRNGEIVERKAVATNAQCSEKEIIDDIISGIEALFDENIVGIGLGSPGLIDGEKGIVFDVSNIPAWKEVHLAEAIENRFKVTTRVSNDANCFVMGEKIFGKGKSYKNIVGVTLGTGVGGGIVIDDKLYNGKFMAGEFSVMPYRDQNFDFYCGSRFFQEIHGFSGLEIAQKAQNGDIDALKIFEEYGEILSDLFKTIILVLNPEAIIIGGSIAKSYKFFEKSLKDNLQKFSLKRVIEHTKIEISTLEDVAVIGAAALVHDQLA
ncbi:MAG: ROK family protein [Bacteroidales bacterium]|jgi:glucokinase|nr:ROK family protein [Bacteroidales bacterium]